MLLGGSGVLKTKRHYVVTIHPRWSFECYVCRIGGGGGGRHQDLIEVRICVEEG